MPRFIKTRRGRIVAIGLLFAGLLIVALAWYLNPNRLDSPARRHWKDNALAELQQRLRDPAAITIETRQLNASIGQSGIPGNWDKGDLLAMQNGEWIVCRNICRKENALVRDLFVGYASDGRWYYSTFHFCRNRIVLQIEFQPKSLNDFIDGYYLKSFDGVSDDCLQETWTGGAWGDEKFAHRSR